MSEIPFVNRLGDALEAAVAHAPAPVRPRRRGRLGLYLAMGALVAGGTAAAAGLLSSEKQATAGVGCYDGSGVAVVWAGDRSPVDVCAGALGRPASELVACAHEDTVAVVVRGAGGCAAAGYTALGTDYEPERRRVAALEHEVIALERGVDCLPPDDLAGRVQAVLDRRGWTGWTTRVRDGSGPCGAVSGPSGDGRRSLSGALDAEHHVVLVSSAGAFSTMEALYGADGLAGPLMDASGAACFTRDALTALADRRLRRAGLRVGATATQRIDEGVQLLGARGTRYDAGCAVISGMEPGADPRSVTLQVSQR
jgi:hypothetical protein